MKKTPHILALLFAATAIISCQKVEPGARENTPQTLVSQNATNSGDALRGGGASNGCPPTEATLVAGRTIPAGVLSVTNDAEFAYVTYTADSGWSITQTHLYVGEWALIPVSGGGNARPGQFPYAGSHEFVSEVTYQVPMSVFTNNFCLSVAAHAVVVRRDENNNIVQRESAWGNGTRINPNGGAWGMAFNYCACGGI